VKAPLSKVASSEQNDKIQPMDLPDEAANEPVAVLPDLDPSWNQGKFVVNITRCRKCNRHYDFCRHSEDEYLTAFNDLGDEIQTLFPQAEIKGNYEKPKLSGTFDVYVRGVGPVGERDEEGRYFLYKKKKHNGKMPSSKQVTDKLTILANQYGDSMKLETAQNEFLYDSDHLVPKKYKHAHDHPAPEYDEG
jgi:hypothetical protein